MQFPIKLRIGRPRDPDAITHKKMYIIVDNDSRSQLLFAELNRDWTEPNPKAAKFLSGAPSAELAILQGKRNAAFDKIVFIHRNDERNLRYLESYPAYRFGEYEKFQPFDERTFSDQTYPLLTVTALLHNINVDVKRWKRQCEHLTEVAEADYVNTVMQWAAENHTFRYHHFSRLYFDIEQNVNPPSIDVLKKEFGKLPDMPPYVEPDLPPCPELPFPWELPKPYQPTLLPGEH